MADKRNLQRIRRRLRVDLVTTGGTTLGFTTNVSPGGCQFQSSTRLAPGAKVRGRLTLPGSCDVPFEAEVRWSRRCSELLTVSPPTALGLRFLAPPAEDYFRFLQDVSTG